MFPPRFKQSFAFQPFKLFRCSFWDNSNSVHCVSGFPHWWGGFFIGRCLVERSERRHAYIKWFGGYLLCHTCHQSLLSVVAKILIILHTEIVRWPCGKVICCSQMYIRDHWVMHREALWLYTIILYSSLER